MDFLSFYPKYPRGKTSLTKKSIIIYISQSNNISFYMRIDKNIYNMDYHLIPS